MPNWQTNGNVAGASDFLGTTNNQALVVQTNGTERLRVLADGKVGVGLSNPEAEVHARGRIASGLDNSVGGTLSLLSPDAFAAFHIDNGPSGGRPNGQLRFSHGATPGVNEIMTIVQDGNIGIGLTTPIVRLHVVGNRVRLESAGRQLDLRSDGAHVDVQSDTNDLYLHSLGPNGRNNVIINPFGQSGNVAVGLTNPAVKFHVVGNRVRLESGGRQLDLRSDGAHVDVETRTSDLYLHSLGPRGRNNVIINPFGQSGNVAVGLTNPAVKFHVVGNRIRLESGGRQLDLRSDGAHVDVETRTSDLYLHSRGPRGQNNVIINPFGNEGNVGIGTTTPTAKLHVVGSIRTTGDIILENADCAEEFETDSGAIIEPGTVMSLTDSGSVTEARKEYDRRVAGVVSGAGSFKPGIILDRRDGAQGRIALALLGKVYCKVDTSFGAIRVGDMLTTSPTPGHAMLATDSTRSFGAVIGKALGEIKAGRGLVPVLVALQ